jgi:hypothetical protein
MNVFSRALTADVARNIVLLAIDPRSAETSCENENKRGSVSGVVLSLRVVFTVNLTRSLQDKLLSLC